jgi:hypothetical protein
MPVTKEQALKRYDEERRRRYDEEDRRRRRDEESSRHRKEAEIPNPYDYSDPRNYTNPLSPFG